MQFPDDRLRKVILTFDLENELYTDSDWLYDSIGNILELLEKYKSTATFFTVGRIARTCPDLIQSIVAGGHGLGCHGAYSHETPETMSRESFRQKLIRSVAILRETSGQAIVGFRAPFFSCTRKSRWVFDVLEELGFLYDSSLCQTFSLPLTEQGNPLSVPGHPGILEFPVSRLAFLGLSFPAGGIYFSGTPFACFIRGLRDFTRSGIPVLYFHPHDFNRGQCLLKKTRNMLLNPFRVFSMKKNTGKLEWLLKNFDCLSVEQYTSLSRTFQTLRSD